MPKPKKYIQEPKTLGEHILKNRLEKGLFQEDVAALIGVTSNSITNWELNHNQPDLRFYPSIIKFLGYNPFELKTLTLCDRIQTYRILHGMSQEKLADKLGINESTVFNYEKGNHKPTKKILAKLDELFRNEKSIEFYPL